MKAFGKLQFAVALVVAGLGSRAVPAADVLLNFDLSAVPSVAIPSGTATAVGFGLAADLLTRGTSLTPLNLAGGFSSQGWITGTAGVASTYENAVAYGQYYQFGLSVNPGATASLQTLDINLRRSAIASASNLVWQYSLDGFATPGVIITSTAVTVETGSAYYATGTFNYLGRNSGSLSGTIAPYQWMSASVSAQDAGNPLATLNLAEIAPLQNLAGGASVQFRLYGWNNGSGATTNTLAIARNQGPKITGLLSYPLSGTISWAGDSVNLGGSGTWSAVAPTWFADGRSGPWATASHGNFGGATSGTVDLRADITSTGGLSFDTDGYVVATTGSTPVSLTLGGPSSANRVSVVAGGTATISVPLAGTAGIIKSGEGTLVVAGSVAPSGTVSVQQGVLAIANTAAFVAGSLVPTAGGTARLAPGGLQATVAGLAPNAGGLTDVTNGKMTISAGLSAADLVTALLAGRGDGSWNGTTGVSSSVAAEESAQGIQRSVGWLDNGDGSLTVAYAAPGDTNLDWVVDILDVSNLASAGKYGTGEPATWAEGDFNYDGIVDIQDVADFSATGLYGGPSYNGGSGTADAVSAVPEPAPGILLALAACAGVGRVAIGRRLFGVERP